MGSQPSRPDGLRRCPHCSRQAGAGWPLRPLPSRSTLGCCGHGVHSWGQATNTQTPGLPTRRSCGQRQEQTLGPSHPTTPPSAVRPSDNSSPCARLTAAWGAKCHLHCWRSRRSSGHCSKRGKAGAALTNQPSLRHSQLPSPTISVSYRQHRASHTSQSRPSAGGGDRKMQCHK